MTQRKWRVGLLGLGTVGWGVYSLLNAYRRDFEIVQVAVQHPARHAKKPIRPVLLTDDPWEVLQADCDLVVEAIGGIEPTRALLGRALESGIHVVSANKEVIAKEGQYLRAKAQEKGVALECSAAVGGEVPVLETAQRLARQGGLERVLGVLNGTTNYILDRVAQGADFGTALAEAQDKGFAEADPTDDLSGADVAHKLVILAQVAFGVSISLSELDVTGLTGLTETDVRAARENGEVYRLVARLERNGGQVRAQVSPERLPAAHPLAQIQGEENRVLFQPVHGRREIIEGLGAGRWPTARSVLSDILRIRRLHQRASHVRGGRA